ncbi:MAG: hypothetical protein BECKG1743D_GA0114223_105252 [Candidatus Kentron sp. G]|nr:MAG: hypothetical protein BECKG1743F_GA0114225_104942 [Candidatus Kentron sp. G]VFN02381.1 MAG: hypothetical protein BECKG1743E_GA0114224_105012 [Candidatus Kentron sp. G]VFN03894.1 MAG: hypothetical protein BECKG1743D_GA0114223_105252 [Candidatus Kentron sp. G]
MGRDGTEIECFAAPVAEIRNRAFSEMREMKAMRGIREEEEGAGADTVFGPLGKNPAMALFHHEEDRHRQRKGRDRQDDGSG